jgi:hypothetical protein
MIWSNLTKKFGRILLLFSISFLLIQPFSQLNIVAAAPGLVAEYGFNETSGTNLNDSSGMSNHGVVAGAVWNSAGKYGGALSFDGSNDWVSVADSSSLDLTNGLTLEAWVKPATSSGWRTVILKERSGHLSYSLYGSTDSGLPSSEIVTNTNYDTRGASSLPLNNWSHLAASYDGANLRLFVNGNQVSSRAVAGNIATSSEVLRIGGNSIWGEYFQGLIDEVRIYNRALSVAEIQTDMNTPIGTPSGNNSPSVSITSPTDGASLSASINVNANASDDTGVAGVQFLLDDNNLGIEDVSPPYSVSWDTTNTSNGTHTLKARARDTEGLTTTSAPINVTVANAPSANTQGQWAGIMNWPLVAVHGALLYSGKILLFDAWEFGNTAAKVWDPVTNSFLNATISSQIFCAAHSALADGRQLVVGGHNGGEVGIRDTNIFDPANNSWQATDDMQFARWYPSDITLPDGRVVTLSGQITPGVYADVPEIYNPSTNQWSNISVNTSSLREPEYPLTFLLPNGKIYTIGPTNGSLHTFDVNSPSWVNSGSISKKGSAVMYRPGKILYTGGGCQGCASTNQAQTIDLNLFNPSWQSTQSMGFQRYNHNLVILPDGKVMAVGGSKTVDQESRSGTLTNEIWDPATGSWATVASFSDPRMYHSIALLLPDGRVLSAGGGRLGQADDYHTAQIYSPPYLFKGTRPVITTAPTGADYGQTITINTAQAAGINTVNLVRLGSVTHTLDMDQRYVELSFTKGANELQATLPTNGNLLPPGYYMLHIVDTQGVPSVSKIIKIGGTAPIPDPDPDPDPAPTGLVAAYNFNAGSGSALADGSGNNLHGTLSGATWSTTGKYGKALSFDGTNDWVTINDNNLLDLSNGMTLEAWVRPTNVNGWRTALLKENGGNLSYSLYALGGSKKPRAEILAGGNQSISGGSNLATNTWYHLATTFDGGVLRLYLNGNQIGSKNVASSIATSSGPLRIGGNSVWGEYFKGLIDEVRIYNKALSQSEIQSDMNTPLP